MQTVFAALALLLIPAAIVLVAALKELTVAREVLSPAEELPPVFFPLRQLIRAGRRLQVH